MPGCSFVTTGHTSGSGVCAAAFCSAARADSRLGEELPRSKHCQEIRVDSSWRILLHASIGLLVRRTIKCAAVENDKSRSAYLRDDSTMSFADRIPSICHEDGYGSSCCLCGQHNRSRGSNDEIDLKTNQFRRKLRQSAQTFARQTGTPC